MVQIDKRPYPRVCTPVGEDDLTRQEFKDSCDINNIVKAWKMAGYNPDKVSAVVDLQAAVEDATGVDYQSHLNAVIDANDAFMKLPSDIRERFANNPNNLLKFVMDDANYAEALKLGLVVEKQGANPAEAVAPQGMQAGEAGGSEGVK